MNIILYGKDFFISIKDHFRIGHFQTDEEYATDCIMEHSYSAGSCTSPPCEATS